MNAKFYVHEYTIHKVFMVTLVISLLLTACASGGPPLPPSGDFYAIQPGSNFYGVLSALAEKPGTVILENPQKTLTLIGYPFHGGYGFTCANCQGDDFYHFASTQKGFLVRIKDFSDTVKYLQSRGWQIIGGGMYAVQQALRVMSAAAPAYAPTIIILFPGCIMPEGIAPVEVRG